MRILIITVVCSLSFVAQSQSVEHSAFLGSNFSSYTLNNSETNSNKTLDYWDVGAKAGYGFQYFFHKNIGIGTSIEYYLTRAEFYNTCYCAHPDDRTVEIRNQVSSHSIDIPASLRIKTNKTNYTYLQTGLGISWLIYGQRKVEIETNFDLTQQEDPIREEIYNDSYSLRNKNNNGLGSYFLLGIGQNIKLKGVFLFVELAYRKDLNFWIYNTVPAASYDIVRKVSIKRSGFILTIGISFNNLSNDEEV